MSGGPKSFHPNPGGIGYHSVDLYTGKVETFSSSHQILPDGAARAMSSLPPSSGYGRGGGGGSSGGGDSGGGGGKKGGCFIATAAYGTPFAHEIDTLRQWRDEDLTESYVGKFFVDLYYKVSPPIARIVEKSGTLRRFVRTALSPVVKVLRGKYEQ